LWILATSSGEGAARVVGDDSAFVVDAALATVFFIGDDFVSV
jgi:hypothetical protein